MYGPQIPFADGRKISNYKLLNILENAGSSVVIPLKQS